MSEESIKLNSYLTFHLGEELFALEVMKVKEILELSKVARVPKSPDYMRGVVNLRGSVLPVVDLAARFGIKQTEDTQKSRIVVLDLHEESSGIKVGAVVDSVTNVLELNPDSIQPPPNLQNARKKQYISGMIHHQDDFIMILDIDKIFTAIEADKLTESQFQDTLSQ